MITLRKSQIIEQTATRETATYQVNLREVETDREWGWFRLETRVNNPEKQNIADVDYPSGCKYVAILMPLGATRGMSIEGEYFNHRQLLQDLGIFFHRAEIEFVPDQP